MAPLTQNLGPPFAQCCFPGHATVSGRPLALLLPPPIRMVSSNDVDPRLVLRRCNGQKSLVALLTSPGARVNLVTTTIGLFKASTVHSHEACDEGVCSLSSSSLVTYLIAWFLVDVVAYLFAHPAFAQHAGEEEARARALEMEGAETVCEMPKWTRRSARSPWAVGCA